MQIGELAAAAGVSVRSVRYYESVGLIDSARQPNGWRDFDPATVDRIVTVQHLFAAGLCSRRIRALLPCLHVPPADRTGYLDATLAVEIDRLQEARRQVDRELDVLRELRDDLRRHPAP